MISFSSDYNTAVTRSNNPFSTHEETCNTCRLGDLCAKGRALKSLRVWEYGYSSYFLYLCYPPLYLAGPIISFNDFAIQTSGPSRASWRVTGVYAARWLGIVLLMETMMHLFYVVAIKDTKAWAGLSFLEIFTVGFWNLKLIWLKVYTFLILVDDHLEVF